MLPMTRPSSASRGLQRRQCRAACHVASNESQVSTALSPADAIFIDESLLVSNHGTGDAFDQNVCSLPPDAGPCTARIPRFYHSEGVCLKFAYGGCSGNPNNFFTRAECEEKCVQGVTDDGGRAERVELLRARDPCNLPVDRGKPCLEDYGEKKPDKRFFFDGLTCKEFEYTGCQGNENNFANLAKCQERCNRRVGA